MDLVSLRKTKIVSMLCDILFVILFDLGIYLC